MVSLIDAKGPRVQDLAELARGSLLANLAEMAESPSQLNHTALPFGSHLPNTTTTLNPVIWSLTITLIVASISGVVVLLLSVSFGLSFAGCMFFRLYECEVLCSLIISHYFATTSKKDGQPIHPPYHESMSYVLRCPLLFPPILRLKSYVYFFTQEIADIQKGSDLCE